MIFLTFEEQVKNNKGFSLPAETFIGCCYLKTPKLIPY